GRSGPGSAYYFRFTTSGQSPLTISLRRHAMRAMPGAWGVALAIACIGFMLAASPAGAQGAAGGQQPPPGGAGAQAGAQSALDKPVNINLRDIPLKSALELLFQGTGLNYAVDPTVPNVLLTINLKDQPLRTALRTMIHL